ncbi:MAG TPA: hypothetical protein VLE46_07540 [Nitrospira sp.]|nr:hypothetical protein [Nitrospira sp.]
MWRRRIIILLSIVYGAPALAADIAPPSQPPPSIPSDPPIEKSKPDTAPSTRDPGMVKEPETVPHPDSVVTPPVIDPKMAVDPEAKTDKERHPMLPSKEIPPSNK